MSIRTHLTRFKRKARTKYGARRSKDRENQQTYGTCNDTKYYSGSGQISLVGTLRTRWTDADFVLGKYLAGYKARGVLWPLAMRGNGRDTITYDVDVTGKMKKTTGYHYCDHFKAQWCNLPHLYCAERVDNSNLANVAYYDRRRSSAFTLAPLKEKRLEGFKNRDEGFSTRAYRTMLPRFEGDISLINFIWELKDFKHMAKTARKLDLILHKNALVLDKVKAARRLAYSLIPDASGNAKNKNGGKLKSFSKLVAEINLFYQYAVKPTLNDLGDIATTLSQTAEQAQSRFYSDGQTPLKRHYTEVTTDSNLVLGTKDNYRYGTGISVMCKRVAESQFSYDYRIRKGMDLIKKYWGLNLGAVEAWNMLPGSFLVDYIFTINKSLTLMRTDDNVSVSQGLWGESAKFVQSQGLHLVSSPKIVAFVVDGNVIIKHDYRATLVDGHHYTWYNRKAVNPLKYGIVLPKFKIPSMQQGINVLSLARCFI